MSDASRVRNCLLAAAVADSGVLAQADGQSLLFDGARLSDDVWLALATCEAVSRNGGRIGGEQAAAVLREWFERRRFRQAGADSMKPLRDLAAGVEWTRSGSVEAGDAAASMIRVAPLAFVLDLANGTDRDRLREVVRITSIDAQAEVDAMATVAALRACLTDDVVPDARSLTGASAISPVLIDALDAAARHSDDLEAALSAAPPDNGDVEGTRRLTGLLLGASGCAIPRHLLAAIPERSEIEAIIEPFAQLLTAAA